jgi:hypothetical protein
MRPLDLVFHMVKPFSSTWIVFAGEPDTRNSRTIRRDSGSRIALLPQEPPSTWARRTLRVA